jgi:hypothetical protein
MGKPELDKQIMGTMKTWGGNYDSTVGDNHDTCSDKIDKQIDGKDVTLNVMSKMDAPHPKPASDNPGVDKAFWAKGDPQMDTTGHGKLTMSTKQGK